MHISLNSGCKLLFYVEKDYFYCRFLNLIAILPKKGDFSKEKPSFFWSDYFSGQALWLPYIKHPFIFLPINPV